MKALVVEQPGDQSIASLKIAEVATPKQGEGQVLVEVHATALNPVDYKVVEEGVSAWHVGDRVSGHGHLAKDGCFAEQVVVPTYQLAKIPDSVSYEEAASVLCSGLTAYTAVERKPNLHSANTMLVHAGAGGVGSIAIQLAKLHGLQVFTTVSTKKVPYVKKLKPDAIIDYRREDVSQRIKELTNGRGVDVIIDTVGKAEAQKDLDRLAYNGTLVTIVDVPDIDPEQMFSRALNIDVVNLGGAHRSGDPVQQAELGKMDAEMLQLVAAGKVDPLIEKVISFDQIKKGLQAVKDHQVVGKLVVKIKCLMLVEEFCFDEHFLQKNLLNLRS